MDFTNVSFPGVGIDAFKVKGVAFTLGSLQVCWSTLIILVGAILAFFYVAIRGKKRDGIKKRVTLLITAAAVVLGLIGARLAYVISTMDTVIYNTFGDVMAIGNGLSLAGALIGGLLAIFIMSDLLGINGLRVVDMFLPGVMLVQVLAAVGTFMNAELFGSTIGDTTSFYFLFNSVDLASGEGTLFHLLRMSLDRGGAVLCYHPVFLYAFVWNLIGFVVLHFTYKRARFNGQTALIYFTSYGLGMALLKGLDGPRFGAHGEQIAAFVVGVLALVMLIVRFSHTFKRGIVIDGDVPAKRSFSRMMTDEEREAKKEADVAEITKALVKKADEVYDDMTAEPSKEEEAEA